MLLKTAILFLAAMVLIGMIGSKLFPGALKRRKSAKHPTCSRCGRYLIGKGGCDCGKKG